jgi:hypothetical protein
MPCEPKVQHCCESTEIPLILAKGERRPHSPQPWAVTAEFPGIYLLYSTEMLHNTFFHRVSECLSVNPQWEIRNRGAWLSSRIWTGRRDRRTDSVHYTLQQSIIDSINREPPLTFLSPVTNWTRSDLGFWTARGRKKIRMSLWSRERWVHKAIERITAGNNKEV